MKIGDVVLCQVDGDKHPRVGVILGIDDRYPISQTNNKLPVYRVLTKLEESLNECWLKPVPEELQKESLETVKFYYEL